MIIGSTSNLSHLLSSRIGEKAVEHIKTILSLRPTMPGKYEINDEIFYYLFDNMTKNESEAGWEAHRQFLDLHIVLTGNEAVQFNHISNMKPLNNYQSHGDYQIFTGESNGDTILSEGLFLLVEPEDVHKTNCMVLQVPSRVLKIVFKIKIN